MSLLTVVHLYPMELNIYGDSGNVTALQKRLEWRGHDVRVVGVGIGQSFDFAEADIVFGGGGQDSGQLRVVDDLLGRARQLREAVDDGLPLLAVCALYQLLGERFTTHTGSLMRGVGVFGAVTVGTSDRKIGNTVIDSPFGQIVGFENHSGETVLHPTQRPLGRVVRGYGNNADRDYEGALRNNAIGTYLHGPVLPKNPALADHLISAARRRRQLDPELSILEDRLELTANAGTVGRPQ